VLRFQLRLTGLVLGLALLAVIGPVAVSAQEGALVGYLVDDTDLQPVRDAQITLVDGERRLTTVSSDAVGAFQLAVPRAAQNTRSRPVASATPRRCRRKGGHPHSGVPDPPGRRRTRSHHGDRPEQPGTCPVRAPTGGVGPGIFLDPGDVRAMELKHAAEVLDDQEKIWFNWTWGRGVDGFSGRFPDIRTFLGRGCMMYAIDGRAIWEPPPRHPDAGVNPWLRWPLRDLRAEDVVAVEIYRSTNEAAPDVWKLGVSRDPDRIGSCGVTVFWTRVGW
jgi:hypothetical protein